VWCALQSAGEGGAAASGQGGEGGAAASGQHADITAGPSSAAQTRLQQCQAFMQKCQALLPGLLNARIHPSVVFIWPCDSNLKLQLKQHYECARAVGTKQFTEIKFRGG
jgi:hypothetical protein